MAKKAYGWIYDKSGNKKEVFAPVNGKGKEVKKPRKTLTGARPASVGFSGFKS